MRLYDIIQQQAGSNLDYAYSGVIGNFAKALQTAQCFELSPTVVTACAEVCGSKPSSVLAAAKMLRLPYQKYGWNGILIVVIITGTMTKSSPIEWGVVTTNEKTTNRGFAYWAWWHHSYDLTIAPFGIAFDWELTRPPIIEQLIAEFNLPKYLLTAFEQRIGNALAARSVLVNTKKWHDQANSQKEINAFINLEKRATIVPNHYAMKFIQQYNLLDTKNPAMINFTDDICGELPFIESFIIMLNSKHILDHTQDDFSRLNKARSKQKKAPLREFTTTKLKLTRTSINRARAAGINRDAVRAHLCRGHFKTRATGVYWWSPHFRGTKNTTVKRTQYKVD